ncbi:MAG: hypothetical protein KDD66_18165 [Bdellovibrionales bacterium]|nr:hypothetical protein [Bdellovibrionales bacterium]
MRIDAASCRHCSTANIKCYADEAAKSRPEPQPDPTTNEDTVTISDRSRRALRERNRYYNRERFENADCADETEAKNYKRLRHYAEEHPVTKRILNHYNDWLEQSDGTEKGLESFKQYLSENPKVARYASAHTAFFEHLLG